MSHYQRSGRGGPAVPQSSPRSSCEIHWKPGKDLTHATVKKKGKGGKKGKTVTKVEAVPSFFRFFESIELDEAKAKDMEHDEVMAVSACAGGGRSGRGKGSAARASLRHLSRSTLMPLPACRFTSRCRQKRTSGLFSRTRSSPMPSTGSLAR